MSTSIRRLVSSILPQIKALTYAVYGQSTAHAIIRFNRLRFCRTYELYRDFYVCNVFRNLFRRSYNRLMKVRARSKLVMCAAVAFNFKSSGISDQEMKLVSDLQHDVDSHAHEEGGRLSKLKLDESETENAWQLVLDQPNFMMWRRRERSLPHLWEYKCIGRIDDITPIAFFAAQLDLDYRKQWDTMAIELKIVDKDKDQELVKWITHFPYPMYPREYLYLRRASVDQGTGVMLLSARNVTHPQFPQSNEYVRVPAYHSQMVIIPHTTFDQKGFEYVATHFVDPNSNIPSLAYNYGVKYGLPSFLEELHQAAKNLTETKKLEKEENENYWMKFAYATGVIIHCE